MSAGHTPGRLSTDCADHDEPYQNIKLQVGKHTVATVYIDDAPVHDYNREQRANARRLVACWNACEGISTDELVQIADTGGMLGPREDVARIAAQRDELLAALREAKANAGNPEAVYLITRAAIAKVTGVPT